MIFIPKTTTIKKIENLNVNTKMFTFDISLGSQPGQFVNIWIPDLDEKPFSVAFDNGQETKVAISKVGIFTEKIFQMNKGDKVGMRGAFGKQFSIFENKKIILVGGGFGAAPLHFLGTKLQEKNCHITMIIGARNKDLLIYEKECINSSFDLIQTTNDGSKGIKGFVTNALEEVLKNKKYDFIQTCGPEKMMEAVVNICKKKDIDYEVSLERYMKCGFGICGQCACNKKLVCTDGPIFNKEEIKRMPDFGKFHRDKNGKKIFF